MLTQPGRPGGLTRPPCSGPCRSRRHAGCRRAAVHYRGGTSGSCSCPSGQRARVPGAGTQRGPVAGAVDLAPPPTRRLLRATTSPTRPGPSWHRSRGVRCVWCWGATARGCAVPGRGGATRQIGAIPGTGALGGRTDGAIPPRRVRRHRALANKLSTYVPGPRGGDFERYKRDLQNTLTTSERCPGRSRGGSLHHQSRRGRPAGHGDRVEAGSYETAMALRNC